MNNWKDGEKLFQQLMQQQGYVVEDVANNPNYWDKDIDFIITSPTTGATKSFEVKWDSCINRTNNLYLETVSRYSKNHNGWYNFCQADYIAYGDAKSKVFYIIPFQELKQRVQQMQPRQGRCGQDSIGLLVSLEDIKDIIQGVIYNG